MTRFLLATDSVHATAAGCDYLEERLDTDDTVIALTVLEDDGTESERDAADALNVATVRLPGATRTERRAGNPTATILDVAAKREVEEIVLVATGTGEVGSTIRNVLAAADQPVVIVQPA